MAKVMHILAVLAVIAAFVGVLACGDGGDTDVVAMVGHGVISRSSLEHWTAALGASDFYEHIGKRAPAALLPGHPNTSSCVKAAAGLVPPASQPKPSGALNTARCRELYREVREQALAYLIGAQWRFAEGAAQGIVVSDGEMAKALQLQRSEFAREPGQFRAYLANRGRTRADDLFELRDDLVTRKLIEKYKNGHPDGGTRYAIGRLAANAARQRATTDCRAGVVVPECKQYRPSAPKQSQSTPALIIEAMSKTY